MPYLAPQFQTPTPRFQVYPYLHAPAFQKPVARFTYPFPIHASAFQGRLPSIIWLTATQFQKPLPLMSYSGYVGSLPFPITGITALALLRVGGSGSASTYVA
jgi:hypothetical protein